MQKKELILNYLAENLSKGRLNHILGVAETAINLAINYGADPQKAELAGLLHDCAKEWKKEALLAKAESHNLIWDKTVDPTIYEGMMYIAIAGLGFTASEKFAKKEQK